MPDDREEIGHLDLDLLHEPFHSGGRCEIGLDS
jgi:hypothetical protein